MKVYVVLIEDKHADPEVKLFRSKEEAIEYAKDTALDYCKDEEDLQERTIADWAYFVQYSCEGDYIRVTEERLD